MENTDLEKVGLQRKEIRIKNLQILISKKLIFKDFRFRFELQILE